MANSTTWYTGGQMQVVCGKPEVAPRRAAAESAGGRSRSGFPHMNQQREGEYDGQHL